LDTMNGLLAWRMQVGGKESTARIVVKSAKPGSTAMEMGLVAPASARGKLVLTIQAENGIATAIPVAGYGLDTIQGLRIPLTIASDRNEILLGLSSTDEKAR